MAANQITVEIPQAEIFLPCVLNSGHQEILVNLK
jgi:hypothetical protein